MSNDYRLSCVLPRLTDVRAESVSRFFQEHSAYVKSVGAEHALSMRDCLGDGLLECICLLRPSTKKSDPELKRYLESLLSYSCIEDAYSAFDALSMDLSLKDPHSRVFKLLSEFLEIQRRSKGFGIPEKALLPRFAKAVRPLGVSLSLLTRISDDILPSLSNVVEATLADLIDFERCATWKRTSSSLKVLPGASLEPGIKRIDRGKAFKERLCFKCHQPGHLANVCTNPKTETVRYLNFHEECPSNLSNPLSYFGKEKK
ncbi:hypothetical protein RCL1_008674 [Eukaryota sp. TZLM3-RCL]